MYFFRSTLCAYILFNKLGSIIDLRIGCLYWTHMLWHESEARCGMMNILNWFKSTQISRWQIQYIFIVPCIYRSIITWLFGHLTIENKAIGHRLSFNFWAPGRVNKPEKMTKTICVSMNFQVIGDLCETPYSYFPNIHGQCLEGILFLDFETDKKQIVHAYANVSGNLCPNTA